MLKLVSEEGTKWSFLDGYNIFGNAVYLMNIDEASKYKLLDENYDKLDVNVLDYLVDE